MSIRALLCDLDGVVYRGEQPCPGAVEGLTQARDGGVRLLFMTNNAGRTPEVVADHLTRLGLPTTPDEVLGASQVAASHLAAQAASGRLELGSGRVVLALGGPGVAAALQEEGLPVRTTAESARTGADVASAAALVQGYGMDVTTEDLAEAAYALAAGAYWLATNDDATIPTARGTAPGNGSYLALLAHASGRRPDAVTGKPHAPAYDAALQRLGLAPQDCLMIGDRLDTDIVGARAAGIPSALVLTGVSSEEDARTADPASRPDHVAATIPDLARLWGLDE